MKKIKIAFLSPITKGGPYFVYKELVDGLNKKYGDRLEIYFFNTKKDWFKLHFIKFDVIFSVIPFLFKPIGTKKFIFNPRGNFELEKKKNNLGNKLLYLAKNNLKFSDKIWLVSYFLADKLNFRKKYDDKIIIIPNFIESKKYDFGEKKYDNKKYKILTITSFKFFNKGKGIISLGNVIKKLGEKTTKEIIWTIVGNDNSNNFKNIKKQFDIIKFSSNIHINWKGWCNKDEIKNQLQNNDYFIYWTFLDNFPGVILEAITSKIKVLVNNFESFKYFLPENFICKTENEMIEKILEDEIEIVDVGEFEKEKVLVEIYKLIND